MVTTTPASASTQVNTGILTRLGIIAGPLYVIVSLAQAITRDGFDLSKHAWSLLANGPLGWIQITNLILSGAMIIAASATLRAFSKAVSVLVAVYGAGMVGAGIFRADPAQGFPPGTPETGNTVSWHGLLHLVTAGIGFLCLIAACLIAARKLGRTGHRALAWFSGITGTAFLAGFAGVASGSHGPITLAFVAAVILVSAWLTTIFVQRGQS